MFDKWPPEIGIDPYYCDKWRVIYRGDCRELSLSGISSVVTDPPYELGFMGKSWDSKGVSFRKDTWERIRTYCLSGAPLLSFGGSRTQHRIACAIEDAGWEIRDTLMWVYGSGFPKSLDISKAIDKANRRFLYDLSELQDRLNQKRLEKKITLRQINRLFGVSEKSGCAAHKFCDKSQPQLPTREQMQILDSVLKLNGELWELYDEVEREVIGYSSAGLGSGKTYAFTDNNPAASSKVEVTAPATPEAQLWSGYGTALKPAYEPIILAMNPLDGTFANNALKHKVAGLNIDGCRVGFTDNEPDKRVGTNKIAKGASKNPFKTGISDYNNPMYKQGRFPANFLHDGSQMVMELFPNSRTNRVDRPCPNPEIRGYKWGTMQSNRPARGYDGDGSAARFFYCAKASRSERAATNNHPTVKPLALMEYLCKLVKMPEYNLVLDPFCGSGTTLLACASLGVRSIGIEADEAFCEIAANRCAADAVAQIQEEVQQ